MVYYILFIYNIPFIIYIFNFLITKNQIFSNLLNIFIKIRNISYIYWIIPFFLFNLFTLLLYLFYSIIYYIFFIFKFFRYQKNLNKNLKKIFFKKMSIYFIFWRYLHLYIKKSIFIIFYIIYSNIKIFFSKIFKSLELFFLLKFFFKYNYIFILLNFRYSIYLYYYLIKIWLKKHLFNLINIDNVRFFFDKKNIYYKYKEDPILNRNKYFKYSTLLFNLYPFLNFKNGYKLNNNNFIFIKNKIIIILFFIFNYISKYVTKYEKLNNLYINLYIFIYKCIINKIINNVILLIIYLFNILLIYLYLIILNLIYFIIIINIYIFYFIFKYIYKFFCKNFNLIKYFIFFLIIIYYSLYINYYLIILLNHYSLYFPLFYIKYNFRIFNFDWIDLSNYYTLISLRNNLIDINSLNNLFYNKLFKELNIKLKPLGFNFTPNINVNLYSFSDYETYYINKDNLLLYNMFSKYNDTLGFPYIKKFKDYTRYINYQFKHRFNNQKWFKSQLDTKIKFSSVALNVSRLKEELTLQNVNKANDHLVKLIGNWPLNDHIKSEYQKHNAWYSDFRKKNINIQNIDFFINKFIKLKNVPLKYIYLNYRLDNLDEYIFSFYLTKKENLKKLSYKKNDNQVLSILNSIYNFIYDITKQKIFDRDKKNFHFKMECRTFIYLHKNLLFKNKIPTYFLTEQRRKRIGPLVSEFKKHDFTSISNVSTMSQYRLYQDISRFSQKCKFNYNFRWVFFKYPYRINNNNNFNDPEHVILNYNYLLETGVKLIKKYYFLKNNNILKFSKLYTNIINSLDLVYFNQLKKYKYWKKCFFFNTLNSHDKSFFSFFDYLKYRKYSHNNNYIHSFFITHFKKDYYHMRIYLIRVLSHLRYYHNHQKISNPWKNLNFINIRKNPVWDNFRDFQYRWHFKEFLFGDENNEKNFENISYISNLFIKNFKEFYLEYFKINKYNVKYSKKVINFKLKVLRKIFNINKFFFFKNKRSKGWTIFNYFNVFSIKFHIKHLLLHSPYSFWLFNNQVIKYDIIKDDKLYYNYYINNNYTKHLYINTSHYSTIFNLYLNIFEIKEDWSFILYDNTIIKKDLFNKSFFYFFNYGNFYYYNLNQLDFFRLLIPLIKNYYDSFLLKLIRYRYIWDYKNFNFNQFFKRFFFSIYNSLNLKWRITIYHYHDTYLKMLKRKFNLNTNYYIKYQQGFIPFWFVFDYYIKLFLKYLFKFYYVKNNYCIWWLKYKFNYTFYFFFYLKLLSYYYKLKTNNIFKYYYGFNFYLIKNIQFFLLNYYIINKKNIITFFSLIKIEYFLYWYKDILLCNNIYEFFIFIIKLKYDKFLLMYNLMLYNLLLFNRKIIINFFNFSIDLKNFIFLKWNIELSLKNFFNIFFNIKNNLVYFKSNYYYYKYTNIMSKKKQQNTSNNLYNFLITKPKFNWNSLRTKSTSFYSYKKLSIFNLRSFFYIYNSYDIYLNINNLLSMLFFPFSFFKNKIFDYKNIYIYIYIYFLFLLIAIFFSKYFFKSIFIVNSYVNSHQLNWELSKKRNISTFLNNANNIKIKLFKNIYIYNKINNLIDFYSILSPVQKNKKKNWWSGILLYDKFYLYLFKSSTIRYSFDQYNNNLPYYNVNNNNNNFYDNINTYKIFNYFKMYNLKFTFFLKFLNEFYMNYFFTIKKENKEYKFYQSNLYFNFPFGFLYWILFVPYFFYAYILSKYHIRFAPSKRRRLYYLFKVLLFDNFKIFIYFNKYLNRNFFNKFYRSKRPKMHDLSSWTKRRLKQNFTPKRHLWYRNLYIRLSGLGDFYFWFSRINFFKYKISYIHFFFNSILKSFYYYWFFIIYILLLFLSIKYIINMYIIKNHFKILYNNNNIINKIKIFMDYLKI